MDTRPQPPSPKPGSPPATPATNKIQHSKPGIGSAASQPNSDAMVAVDLNRPVPIEAQTGPMLGAGGSKISTFGKDRKHEDVWTRTPNTTGNGAIHVKTFHCKLTEDAIMYMDQAVNEWLDAHPQYEVKFVSSTIGTMTGKLKEPALFCQVWV